MILNMIQIVTKNVQVCESARINFETVTREAKRNCKCCTKLCPNWECTCIGEEDTGDLGNCTCPVCDCDTCTSCQVCFKKYSYINNITYIDRYGFKKRVV